MTDPQRAVYGMTYEFWQGGKQIQAFSLDAMHDGAWFMRPGHRPSHRPGGRYLGTDSKYQMPFYVNVISNSDRLFAERMRLRLGQGDRPMQGWVPRGWDDGLGYDLGMRKPFAEGFEHQVCPRRVTSAGRQAWCTHIGRRQPSGPGPLQRAAERLDDHPRPQAGRGGPVDVSECRVVDFGSYPRSSSAAG